MSLLDAGTNAGNASIREEEDLDLKKYKKTGIDLSDAKGSTHLQRLGDMRLYLSHQRWMARSRTSGRRLVMCSLLDQWDQDMPRGERAKLVRKTTYGCIRLNHETGRHVAQAIDQTVTTGAPAMHSI